MSAHWDRGELDGSGQTMARFGPYELVSLVGRGGMGEVWRARDLRKDRVVAVKLLGGWFREDAEFARRFRRESALAAKLNAPNIVPIHDYGEIDGRLFIEMPLIAGVDLGALVAREGRLPLQQTVDIACQVALALDVAHGSSLVHRDVKPSNVLLVSQGDGYHAYLIDFGIARAIDGTVLSLPGAVAGTPAYMAPERFKGDGDHRSDIYALGCVLYEALTGQPAFAENDLVAAMNAHLHVAPPVPGRRFANLRALDDVVARALAKDPAHRFQSALDFAAAARDAIPNRLPARQSTPVAPASGDTRRELRVVGVRVEESQNKPILLLKEISGQRYLVLWIDATQATAIAYTQQGAAIPVAHDLTCAVIDAFRLNIEMVIIHDVTDSVTAASVAVNGLSVATRPTDAVVLALKKNARIYATERLLGEVGLVIPDEPT